MNPSMLDHNSVFLLILPYKQVLKKHKQERSVVPVWLDDSIRNLLDCLRCTDWDCFTDLDDVPETVSQCRVFCEDLMIPHKHILVYPNNKPRLSKAV